MKEDLRPCVVTIGKEAEIFRSRDGKLHEHVIEEGETYKGYFHRWFDDTVGASHKLLAIVEYEDGTIHFVNSSDITFADRQKVTVNICADSIVKVCKPLQRLIATPP